MLLTRTDRHGITEYMALTSHREVALDSSFTLQLDGGEDPEQTAAS